MFGWERIVRRIRLSAPLFEADLRVRAQHINRILERERTRADRNHRPLSMVLLGYDGRARRGEDASVIVTALQERARVTDDVGWFDKRTGFAILPDTTAAGGRRFAESVRRHLRNRGVRTSFAIYQYVPPSKQDIDPPHHDGRGDRRPVEEAAPARGGARQREAAVPALASVTGSHKGGGGAGGGRRGRGVAAGRNGIHELEPAMTQRLPWWKRAGDIVAAGSALLILWPLLVTLGLAIKLDSPGPVIFKQHRAGLGGRPFAIWKFRTMCDGAETQRDTLLHANEQDGPAFKIKADPRVTRLGALLRKTSLDELPQLINVLRGEMTLVGPRPLPMPESDACLPWQRRRLHVTPGLTCIWQVWGRSTVSFDEWVRMDLSYQRRRTPQHDLKILLATVPAVLKQRGAC